MKLILPHLIIKHLPIHLLLMSIFIYPTLSFATPCASYNFENGDGFSVTSCNCRDSGGTKVSEYLHNGAGVPIATAYCENANDTTCSATFNFNNNNESGTKYFKNTTESGDFYKCNWNNTTNQFSNAAKHSFADPEPTNSATNAAATTGSPATSALTVTWTDAVAGSQAASNYLVLCSTAAITNPVDGTAQTDNDCSDGSGALNVSPSTQSASWTGLSAGSSYFFKIYPYTNTGNDINYKLDSPASVAAATQKTDLDALAAPTAAGSAMFTLQDICNRLNTGTEGSQRGSGFTEPSAAPAPTDCSLNTIMAKLPVKDDSNGASTSDVAAGKTFWGLKNGEWGLQTGTKQ